MAEKRRSGAWIFALMSIFIVVGSLFTALLQGGFFDTPPTPEQTSQSPRPSDTSEPNIIVTPSPTGTPIPTITVTPSPTECIPPASWLAYTVQPGDTLGSLAQAVGSTASALQQGNCLSTSTLQPGSTIYLPSLPSTVTPTPTTTLTPTNTGTLPPTNTSVACGPPAGWVRYTVRPGDTLYSLSQVLGVTVAQLQLANCMGSSTIITVGQSLWVPFLPPTASRTPTPSPTGTGSPSPSPTPSNTSTTQPTNTASPTAQPSQTQMPSATPSPTPPPTSTSTSPPPPSPNPTATGTTNPNP